MTPLVQKARAYGALGLRNILGVAIYRAALSNPRSTLRRLRAEPPSGPFFRSTTIARGLRPSPAWQTDGQLFGWLRVQWPEGGVPDWKRSPLSGATSADAPWWTIPDFSPAAGDVKAWWNLSRLDWALVMAQRASEGAGAEWDRLNAWLSDWSAANRPYFGVNWKCGQESSLRVLHLAMTAVIARQLRDSERGLLDLVAIHLARVEPSVGYARAQNNDHGTSEATALFAGGSWLAAAGDSRGARWASMGRAFLEERTAALVSPDGSFSQYSVNYHRMVLDTFSIAEIVRRHLGCPRFSNRWYERVSAATAWLATMVDRTSGRAPNIGANDSTLLLPVVATDVLDFRPSVHRAMSLFQEKRFVEQEGPWDDALRWFDIEPAATAEAGIGSRVFPDSGFVVARAGDAIAVLRYPKFRFRPAHADALHFDLLVKGENILRDDGTYSYAVWNEEEEARHSRLGHNTIEFDGRPQMPKVGRFLYGDWLADGEPHPLVTSGTAVKGGARYKDKRGAAHDRAFVLQPHRLTVTDRVSGFQQDATLRWRLNPGEWRDVDGAITNGRISVRVSASEGAPRQRLTEGSESQRYLSRSAVPVLEVTVTSPCTLTSVIEW